jgi:hypothetical protein
VIPPVKPYALGRIRNSQADTTVRPLNLAASPQFELAQRTTSQRSQKLCVACVRIAITLAYHVLCGFPYCWLWGRTYCTALHTVTLEHSAHLKAKRGETGCCDAIREKTSWLMMSWHWELAFLDQSKDMSGLDNQLLHLKCLINSRNVKIR